MKYFEFHYIQTVGKEMITQGDAVYYTSGEQNVDEMKEIARVVLNDPTAIISIPLFSEIDRDVFILKGGNPNVC